MTTENKKQTVADTLVEACEAVVKATSSAEFDSTPSDELRDVALESLCRTVMKLKIGAMLRPSPIEIEALGLPALGKVTVGATLRVQDEVTGDGFSVGIAVDDGMVVLLSPRTGRLVGIPIVSLVAIARDAGIDSLEPITRGEAIGMYPVYPAVIQ